MTNDENKVVQEILNAIEESKKLDLSIRYENLDSRLAQIVESEPFEKVTDAFEKFAKDLKPKSYSEVSSILEAIKTHAIQNKNSLPANLVEKFFETCVLYENMRLWQSTELARELDLEITPKRAKLMQDGLIDNGVHAGDFAILQVEHGVPFTKEVAYRYIDRALKGRSTHVTSEVAMQLMDNFNIELTDEQKEAYIDEMVKNGNFDDAASVAEHLGLGRSAINKIREMPKKIRIKSLDDALQDDNVKDLNGVLNWYYMPEEHLLEIEKDKEKFAIFMRKYAAGKNSHYDDSHFFQTFPERSNDFIGARIKMFYESKDLSEKQNHLHGILTAIEKEAVPASILSKKDLKEFSGFAKSEPVSSNHKDYDQGLYHYRQLIACAGLKPNANDIKELMKERLKDDNRIYDYLYLSEAAGIRVPEIDEDIAKRVEEFIKSGKFPEEVSPYQVPDIMERLHKPVTPEHIKGALKVTGLGGLEELTTKYEMPELTEDEKHEIFFNALKGATEAYQIPKARKMAKVFNVNLTNNDFESFVRGHIYDTDEESMPIQGKYSQHAGLFEEHINEIWDALDEKICSEEVLEAYLHSGSSGPARRLALKIGKEQHVLDYMIANRHEHGFILGETLDDNALIKTAAEFNRVGYVMERLVEEKDITGLARLITVVRYNPGLDVNPENPMQLMANLIMLQGELIENKKYSEAERLIKIFPNLPKHPAFESYKTTTN